MTNAFIRKLQAYSPLPIEDVELLTALCGVPRPYPARHDLIREGDQPGPVFVVMEGWVCRYNVVPEGHRQISAFLMPGDCCDLYASVLDAMDHSIATITPAQVCLLPRPRLEEAILRRPAITRAFWWAQLVDEGTLRAWVVSMGRRDSVQRVAHLMCELYIRARNIGLTADGCFELPLSQVVLGDALGLTAVHVNRVLRRLREEGVMTLTKGVLRVDAVDRLARIAGFDDGYLHRKVRRAA